MANRILNRVTFKANTIWLVACCACAAMANPNANVCHSQTTDQATKQSFSILDNGDQTIPNDGLLPSQRDSRKPDVPKESQDASDRFNQTLTQIAIDSLPTKYENTKDWGKQIERWDGIKFRRDAGGKLETKRRKKLVNHGTWKKYSATFRNPKQEFQVKIKNIRESESGKMALDIHIAAHLDIDARQAKWMKGVQLYSINATGHAKISMVATIETATEIDTSEFPPAIVFLPQATHVQLSVDEFRIDRISKIGGELTQQVTKMVQNKLDEEIHEQETKLIEKINKQIEKKKDSFRLGM